MAQEIDYWTKLPFQQLLRRIKEQSCIPFVGPEVCQPWIPLGREIASKWAEQNGYPLEDSYQLSRVAQFLTITYDKTSPRELLKSELKKIIPPDFRLGEFRNTPLAVLADLNLPIYITTNYDHFIEEAIKSKGGKEPISDFCRWSEDLVDYANDNDINSKLYDRDSGYQITSANPLVYHLHGDIDHPESMVLTEKDYIDFVIFLNRESETKVLPLGIRKKINAVELLFVGYSLYDLGFSVIFQTIINSGKLNRHSVGISVQLMSDKGEAQKYLQDYTKEMFNLYVYPGNAIKFSEQLRHQLDNFKV